jgi:glycogen operon protein
MNFVIRLIRLRRGHPAFQRRKWFKDRDIWGACVEDICWYQPSGKPMMQADWDNEFARSLAIYLSGRAVGIDDVGQTINDNDFYLALNAYHEPVPFRLPRNIGQRSWRCILDTSQLSISPETPESLTGDHFVVAGHGLILWEVSISE